MRPLTAALLLLGLLPARAQAQDGAARAAASITPGDIAARIGVIADDSMRGRWTPSPELEQVAAYVAGEFRRVGLAPLGDASTFIQQYAIERAELDTLASTVAVRGGPTLRFGADAITARGGYAPDGVTGPTVLVSGVAATPDDVRGLDVAGKIVIAVVPTEPSGQPTRLARMLLAGVERLGPAAILIPVHPSDDTWTQLVGMTLGSRVDVPWRAAGGVLAVFVRDRALDPVLRRAGVNVAAARAPTTPAARALPGLSLTVTVKPRVLEAMRAPNVVAMLEGSDPVLKHEYVVLSAHMDHVGTIGSGQCPMLGADTICNGADDDASGTIAVVEAAAAFAQLHPRPKRSLLFLTVSGEERGLWGSDYFASHPPVPIDRIVADLNMDMVGRNWKDTIVVIGKEHSDLGSTLARVSARHPELHMAAIDDLWPAERFYFRSDHYNFARRGVPILFFFNGTHPDYHRPGDEPAKIDAEKESRIVKLVFYLGLEIANAAERPRWNPDSYREIVRNVQGRM
jgi:hypothetical protein